MNPPRDFHVACPHDNLPCHAEVCNGGAKCQLQNQYLDEDFDNQTPVPEDMTFETVDGDEDAA